ncbi:MAG: hypothetical protein JWL95_1505 [Gemmatimonadetes bacterium]|nr:hypothetical protein [Gemmatimonadota bacterium]
MLFAISLLALLHAAPAPAPTDSLKGSWQLTGDVAGNALNSTCEIKQTGTEISGSCTDATGARQPIKGAVKDGTVTFEHGGDYQGQALTIIYSGKLDTPTQIKGTVLVKPFDASGTFMAEPVPAKK